MKNSFISKIIFLMMIIETSIYGQATVNGVVLDSLTNEPLHGASISLAGTVFITSTDINGEYALRDIPLGRYVLRVSYLGYKLKAKAVDIETEKTVEQNILLVSEEITEQSRGQLEVINRQINSNSIVNVVPMQKLQDMPDVSIAEAIKRLPGASLLRAGVKEEGLLIPYSYSAYLFRFGDGTNEVVLRGLNSQFSTISIDGVRISPTAANDRGVDLSILSKESFSSIEIFKSITSDKDADALAGSINFITRKAPTKRVLSIEPTGKYNGLDKSANQYGFIGRYGERIFDGLLGVQINGSIEKTIGSSEILNIGYDQSLNNLTDYKIYWFELQYNNQLRKVNSFSVLLDFDLPDNGSIRFNNYFNKYSTDYNIYNKVYSQPYLTYNYRVNESEITSFNSSLRGSHTLLGLNVDWNVSFSESEVDNPFDYSLSFAESKIFYNIITDGGMRDIPAQYNKGPVEQWIPYEINNFEVANLSSGIDRATRNYHKEKSAALNFLRQYTIKRDITGTLKLGGMYRIAARSYNIYHAYSPYFFSNPRDSLKLKDGSIVKKDFSGTRFDGWLEKRGIPVGGWLERKDVPLTYFIDDKPGERNIHNKYRLYPLINWDALRLWRQLNIDGYYSSSSSPGLEYEYIRDDKRNGNSYSLSEKIFAGYIMNTFNFGQSISITTGFRIESEKNHYTGVHASLINTGFTHIYDLVQLINSEYKEVNLLPNFHALFKPSNFLNLHLTAYKSIVRPDYNYRLPKFMLKTGPSASIIVGNPELKNANVWNYELQMQFFGSSIGLLDINAFYKDIKGMHKSLKDITVDNIIGLDTLGVNWRYYRNSLPVNVINYSIGWQYNSTKPTRVYGLEIEHQANFRYLPGLLKNIVLNYNFTLLRSETWVKKSKKVSIPRPPLPPQTKNVIVEEKQKMEEQPEFLANVILGYDKKGFSFRASLFHMGEYDSYYSADQRSDIIVNSFTKLDISLKQRIEDYLTVYVNLNNVTNAKRRTSYANRLQEWSLSNQTYLYGRTIDLGVRVDL